MSKVHHSSSFIIIYHRLSIVSQLSVNTVHCLGLSVTTCCYEKHVNVIFTVNTNGTFSYIHTYNMSFPFTYHYSQSHFHAHLCFLHDTIWLKISWLHVNPFKPSGVTWLLCKAGHTGLTGHTRLIHHCNFWHSGTLALSPGRQSARMSKIKNDGLDQYDHKRSASIIFARIRKCGNKRVKCVYIVLMRDNLMCAK